MPNNPYSSFDFNDWLVKDDVDTLDQDGGFDFDEWLQKAKEAQFKQEEEQERLAQEKAELEKQRKENLAKATQVDEEELNFDTIADYLIQAESEGDTSAVNTKVPTPRLRMTSFQKRTGQLPTLTRA